MVKAKGKGIDLTEGPILRKILVFSIPVVLTGLLQQIYSATDMIVVGQWSADSEIAVGAVGSCGSLITLIIQLFLGLSLGAGVCVAHDVGAQKYDDVKKTVHTAVPLAAVLGIFVSIFGILAAKPLLVLTGVEDPMLLSQATRYMQAYMLGVTASLVYNYCAAMLRSCGDTTRPMIFLAISGLVNVICNMIAVIGFGLGAIGVGIGTAASNWCAMFMVISYMRKTDGILHLDMRKMKIYKEKFWKIVKIGLPSGIQGSVFSVSNVIVQSAVNSFQSTAIVAGNTAASNIGNMVYTAVNGFYHTTVSFVGQNMGAKKLDRVKKVVFCCMGCIAVLGIFLAVVANVFREPLLSLYGIDSVEAFDTAKLRLLIVVATYWLCGTMDMFCGVMRGMGNSTVPMVVSILGTCAFRIAWIYTVFALRPTLVVLYIVYPISWGFTCVVHGVACILIYKQKKRMFSLGMNRLGNNI